MFVCGNWLQPAEMLPLALQCSGKCRTLRRTHAGSDINCCGVNYIALLARGEAAWEASTVVDSRRAQVDCGVDGGQKIMSQRGAAMLSFPDPEDRSYSRAAARARLSGGLHARVALDTSPEHVVSCASMAAFL